MEYINDCGISLGSYKGLSAEKAGVDVSEDEIKDIFEKERDSLAERIEVTGRGIRQGDIVSVDYTGFYRGQPFDGGRGTDQILEIGSDLFVPGFDGQLEAAETGDKLTVNISFPKGYKKMPGLAGKDIEYRCKINGIYELRFPGYDEVRDKLRDRLIREKEEQAESDLEDELLEMIVGNSEFMLDEKQVDDSCESLFMQWASEKEKEGFDPVKYLKVMGSDEEHQKSILRPQAEFRLKSMLVLEAVARAEALEASEEEIDRQIGVIAEQLGMTPERLRERFDDEAVESVKSDIRMMKAMDIVKENAVLSIK